MTQRLDANKVAPGAMKALFGVHAYLGQSGLSATLLDLVYLRVSQINGCAFCIDMHSHDLLKKEMPMDKLILVPAWREAETLFDERERAALAWAENLTRIGQTQDVADEDWLAARAVFEEKELADLTTAVALINAYNRLGVGLRLTPGAVVRAG
jgi:AhpD family alkylhydroperoxidase